MMTETKTQDNVFVKVCVAVQVEPIAEKAYEAIYRLSNPQGQIDSYVSDVIRGQVPTLKLDALFESKDEIAQAVKERLCKSMGEYGYLIHQVLVTDLRPDDKVRHAMNEIDANRRLRVAAAEKAEAEKEKGIKAKAKEKEKKLKEKEAASKKALIEKAEKEKNKRSCRKELHNFDFKYSVDKGFQQFVKNNLPGEYAHQ